MAFGDIVQIQTSGSFPGTYQLTNPVAAGNTILACCGGDHGSLLLPETVSDDLNGSYTLVRAAGSIGVAVARMFKVLNTSLGSPTITFDANTTQVTVIEVEGDLVDSTIGGSGTATASSSPYALSTSTATIPANSVSFGIGSASSNGTGYTVNSPWAVVTTTNSKARVARRADVSEAAGQSLEGSYVGVSGQTVASVWVSFIEAGVGPTLSAAPATAFPGQSITVTGTNFGASQGTGGVTIGDIAQTITAWSDTSITFTTVLGVNSYGASKPLKVTNGSGGVVVSSIELVANTAGGFGYVAMDNPNTTDESSVAFGATPAVVTGDQFEWEDFNNLGNLTVDAQGFVSNVDTAGTFRGRFWDATDQTWGAVEIFTASTSGGDVTSPTVTSVSVPTAGTYTTGQDLDFTVNASESVTVTTTGGTPSIPVTVGATVRQAAYVSGNGTSALLFRYTVQAGDEDADGIAVGSSINLNGGTIKDAAGNDADLTLNSVGDTSGVLVDGVAPVISVNGLTTTDTTPNLTGSAGDAVSLTLDVEGIDVVYSQTYNITPSGGSWSQLSDLLALGSYTLTLNGEDAAGNAATEQAATLSVVSTIPVLSGRPGFNIRLSIGF